MGWPVGVVLVGRGGPDPEESALREAVNPIMAAGPNYLAANISRFFDLRGPSMVIDTACSSALVGMHMAISALQRGEIDAAVVGGVSLLRDDAAHRMFQRRKLLSPDASFHIFDQRAHGVVLGEGVGLVLLKTVGRAMADGDGIHARIKASAINSDGRSAGPAAPNPDAQREVLRTALEKSGRKPGEISYIEVNGSGSVVTDLLELKAIESVYRESIETPCGLGSIKPNIGHPLCAEGIAGFIKVVLMLKHRQMTPFLSGERPLKHYDIDASPFYFPREVAPWEKDPLAAAINCFADGGVNAHVILESATTPDSRRIRRKAIPMPKLNRTDVRGAGAALPPAKRGGEDPDGAPGNRIAAIRPNEFWEQGRAPASNRANKFWESSEAETMHGEKT